MHLKHRPLKLPLSPFTYCFRLIDPFILFKRTATCCDRNHVCQVRSTTDLIPDEQLEDHYAGQANLIIRCLLGPSSINQGGQDGHKVQRSFLWACGRVELQHLRSLLSFTIIFNLILLVMGLNYDLYKCSLLFVRTFPFLSSSTAGASIRMFASIYDWQWIDGYRSTDTLQNWTE